MKKWKKQTSAIVQKHPFSEAWGEASVHFPESVDGLCHIVHDCCSLRHGSSHFISWKAEPLEKQGLWNSVPTIQPIPLSRLLDLSGAFFQFILNKICRDSPRTVHERIQLGQFLPSCCQFPTISKHRINLGWNMPRLFSTYCAATLELPAIFPFPPVLSHALFTFTFPWLCQTKNTRAWVYATAPFVIQSLLLWLRKQRNIFAGRECRWRSASQRHVQVKRTWTTPSLTLAPNLFATCDVGAK